MCLSNHNFVRQKYAILTDLYIQIFFLDLCMLREIITNDWYVGFCLFSLVIVVSAKKIDSQRFSGFLKLFSNSNYLRIYLKEHTFFDSFDTLLFINFCVNIICFSWIGYQLLYTNVDMSFLLLSQLFTFVAGGVILKILLELFLGYVLDLYNLFNILSFQQISSYNFIGLVLLPLNAFLVFGINLAPLAVILVAVLILIISIAGMIKTIQSNLNIILNNFFYFILYLCTFEIGPYLVIYTVVNRA